MKRFQELVQSGAIQTLSRDEQGHLIGGFIDVSVVSDSIDPLSKNKVGQCKNENCSGSTNKTMDGCTNSNCNCTCSQLNTSCEPNRLC